MIRLYPEPQDVARIVALGALMSPKDGHWYSPPNGDDRRFERWKHPVWFRRLYPTGSKGADDVLKMVARRHTEVRFGLYVMPADRARVEALGGRFDQRTGLYLARGDAGLAELRAYMTLQAAVRWATHRDARRREQQQRDRLVAQFNERQQSGSRQAVPVKRRIVLAAPAAIDASALVVDLARRVASGKDEGVRQVLRVAEPRQRAGR